MQIRKIKGERTHFTGIGKASLQKCWARARLNRRRGGDPARTTRSIARGEDEGEEGEEAEASLPATNSPHPQTQIHYPPSSSSWAWVCISGTNGTWVHAIILLLLLLLIHDLVTNFIHTYFC